MRSRLGGQVGRASAEVWAAGNGGEERCSLLLASFLRPPRTKDSSKHVPDLAASHSGMKGWELGVKAGGGCGGRDGEGKVGRNCGAGDLVGDGGRKIVETGEGLGSTNFLSPGLGHRKSNPRASQGASCR